MLNQFQFSTSVKDLDCKYYNIHEPLQHLVRRRPVAHYYQCYNVYSVTSVYPVKSSN